MKDLLANLFGITKKSNNDSATDKPDYKDYIALAKKIVGNGNDEVIVKLEKKFLRYFDDPNTVFQDGEYVYETNRELDENIYRGFSDEDPNQTYFFIMLDTLINSNFISEADWKVEFEDFDHFLKRIIRTKGYNIQSPVQDLTELFSGELIFTAQEKFKVTDYRLLLIDIESDCYVYTVIPKEEIDEIQAGFSKIGIDTTIGKD
jgi:hypothetical protein